MFFKLRQKIQLLTIDQIIRNVKLIENYKKVDIDDEVNIENDTNEVIDDFIDNMFILSSIYDN